jgi:hypothetical protein
LSAKETLIYQKFMQEYQKFIDFYQVSTLRFNFIPQKVLMSFWEFLCQGKPSKFMKWEDLLPWFQQNAVDSEFYVIPMNVFSAFVIHELVNGSALNLYRILVETHVHKSLTDFSALTVLQLQDKLRSLIVHHGFNSRITYLPIRDWSETPPYSSAQYNVLASNVEEFNFYYSQYIETLCELNEKYVNLSKEIAFKKIKEEPDSLVFPFAISGSDIFNEDIKNLVRAYRIKSLFSRVENKINCKFEIQLPESNEILWYSGVYL